MTRLSIMRPPTLTSTGMPSSTSADFPRHRVRAAWRPCSRGRNHSEAFPVLRHSASLARRSAMMWFSSC